MTRLPQQFLSEYIHLSELYARKSDDDCDDDSSGSCQKPVSNDAETIALAVCLPVAVILVVLGYFLFRNYRKDKKELLERDPDFDETGEATALPDFPNGKAYEMDNPFHNRNSIYPHGGSGGARNQSSVSLQNTAHTERYFDDFVLPYQHQTGSKASLDDFARQIGDYSTFTPRASVHGSVGHVKNLSLGLDSQRTSPQKSNLQTEMKSTLGKSPVSSILVKDGKGAAENDSSESSIHQSDYLNEDKDVSDDASSTAMENLTGEKFGIKYENESSLEGMESITKDRSNNILNDNGSKELFRTTENNFAESNRDKDQMSENPQKTGQLFQGTKYEKFGEPDNEIEETVNDGIEAQDNIKETHRRSSTIAPVSISVESPIDNERDELESQSEKLDHGLVDGDFDFSGENSDLENTTGDVTNVIEDRETSRSNLLSPTNEDGNESNLSIPGPTIKRSKSPRISAFNLVGDDSDDEQAEDEKILTAEQEEELRRMKSVYKVYFEGGALKKEGESNLGVSGKPHYDLEQPLPKIPENLNNTRINSHLKMDTSYDKRMSTASSVYTETPIFSSDEQQYYYMQQLFAQNPNYYQSPQPLQRSMYPMRAPALPPLQQLPSASDIRKSTLQTYTDYQPKSKNAVQGSKQPFVPIEDEGVWTALVSSPTLTQSPFSAQHGQQQGYQQGYQQGQQQGQQQHVVPSATQMSRSSVVMLNPVTEITKQRTFRPAGSLPSGGSNHSLTAQSMRNQQYFVEHSQSLTQPGSDLIPGNRKSDVRRMMNSNF